MRARALLWSTLLVLAGCEAGHREGGAAAPGADNVAAGPQLAIVAPGPGQVLRTPASSDVPHAASAATYAMPAVMFELRNTKPAAAKAGDRVWYVLDRRPAVEVADLTRRVHLDALPAVPRFNPPGSHVIRAYVVDAEGTPYTNPGAFAVRQFHLGEPDGAFDDVDESGGKVPFSDDAPHLIVLPPQGLRIRFALAGAQFGARSHRVLVTAGWRRAAVHEPGTTDLGALAEFDGFEGGEVVLELQALEPRDDASAGGPAWRRVPGPFNRATVEVAP
jgi:hypothetical protein